MKPTMLMTMAMLAVSAPAGAQSVQALNAAEREAERQCDEHQKPRQCVTADDEIAFECVSKSPVSAVLHWFERGREDDEVVVVVRSLEAGREPPAEDRAAADSAPAVEVERRVEVREGGPLPQCKSANG